ncbi:hypothetical protein [Ruegeria lacuscaerulensis]|nr:hypothetical protein [Ruegeria lacuscaerulensis]
MATAYFATATLLSLWIYCQTRAAARNIRAARALVNDPLEQTGQL